MVAFNKQVKSQFDATNFWQGGADPYYQGLANEPRNAGLGAQKQALDMYGNQAAGRGPSAAQAMLQQQNQQNLRTAMALQGRQRGGNIGQGGGQVAAMYGGAQSQLAQQSAILRAQEQQAALAGLAGLGSQMYGQGLGYDQLAVQQGLGYQQLQNDWKLGKRGLDLQKERDDKQFWGGMINAGIGAVGSIAGAAGGA